MTCVCRFVECKCRWEVRIASGVHFECDCGSEGGDPASSGPWFAGLVCLIPADVCLGNRLLSKGGRLTLDTSSSSTIWFLLISAFKV